VPRAGKLVAAIVPDAGEMTGELAGGDGPARDRKVRQIALDWRIEIELPLLHQQAKRDRRERLGDAPNAKAGQRRDRDALLEIRKAETLAPDHHTVADHGDRGTGGPELRHGIEHERARGTDRGHIGLDGGRWRGRQCRDHGQEERRDVPHDGLSRR